MNPIVKKAMPAVLTAALVTMFGLVHAQSTDEQIKGVFRDAKRPGVKVVVYRGEGNTRRRVPTDFAFNSGDTFGLELETNQRSYVYVLNRTLPGDPDQLSTKGIERVRDDDRRDRTGQRVQYQLLYPLGSDAKTTTSGKPFNISGFKMDNRPGIEKMLVVVSAQPIDLTKYFDLKGTQRTGSGGGGRKDTEEDVLDQLNKDLTMWSGNAEVSLPKGVTREPEGFGVVRDAKQPGLIELNLRHYAK